MAKIDEILTQSEMFANEFVKNIEDGKKEAAAKTVYFMDNQEDLQKVMTTLQKIVNKFGPDEDGNQPEMSEDDEVLFNKAQEIINRLSDCIAGYKNELMVNENVTEEETTAKVTQETIAEAMQNNDTTKQIAENMSKIVQNQNPQSPQMNFCLMCDGQINMFQANTKQEINNCIQQVTDSGNYKDIALFQVSYKAVPLKKKTIVSV